MSSEENHKITGTALKRVVLKFIPQQLIKDVDLTSLGFDNPKILKDKGLELVQKLMDNSKNRLKMYGSADELLTNLLVFRCFYSSHQFFGIDITEEYNMTPFLIRNSASKFLAKQDVFVLLQNELFAGVKHNHQLPRSIAMIYLKTCEKRLSGCCEFVKFDFNIAEIIQRTFKDESVTNMFSAMTDSIDLLVRNDSEKTLDVWKGLVPEWTDEQFEPIKEAVLSHLKQFPFDKYFPIYSLSFSLSRQMIKIINSCINIRPDLFLPNSEVKTKPALAVARVFQYENRQFVMKSELFNAINLDCPYQEPLTVDEKDGFVGGVSLEDLDKLNLSYTEIEFVKHPLNNTRSIPIPIMTPSGDYCIYVEIALTRIFWKLIHVFKIFQKVKTETWKIIEDYMEMLEDDLGIKEPGTFFISVKKMEQIENVTEMFFCKFENIPAKSVREVRKVGFNVNFLKKELRDLGLIDVFPNIEEYANEVYEHVMDNRERKFLRTCDLYDAVEKCQTKAILERYPLIQKIHRNFLPPRLIIPDPIKEVPSEPKIQESTHSNLVKRELIEIQEMTKNRECALTRFFEFPKFLKNQKSKKNDENLEECDLCVELQKTTEICLNDFKKNFESIARQLNTAEDDLKQNSDDWMAREEEFEEIKSKYEKKFRDNVELKIIISGFEDQESRWKETNKKLTDVKHQLTNKVSSLESQLKAEKQKTHKTIKEAEQQRIDLEREISEINDKNKSEYESKVEKLTKKVNDLEDQLKRVTESQSIAQLESKLVEKNSEMEKLTEKYEEMKNLRQLDDMKNRNLEGLTASLKRTILNHEVTENGLRTRNQQLEAQLESEKLKTHELAKGAIQQLQRLAGGQMDLSFDQEVLKKNKEINELREANIRLTGQIEQQNLTINSFFNHFGPVQSSYSSSSTQTTLSEYSSSQLISLQKIRDSSSVPLELAKTVVDRLISMSTQPEVHEMAKFEYEQYESQTHNYLQSVESMIAQIKTTGECIHSLPNHPSFSDRFINQYWDIMSQNISNEVKDSECFICFNEMKSDEKTLKCDECRKVVHLKCASEWHRIHRSCAHCRRKQLDPNEFPALG